VHGVPLSSASAIITVAVDAARIAAMRRTAMMTTPVAALHQWASRTASHLRIYLRVRTCNRLGMPPPRMKCTVRRLWEHMREVLLACDEPLNN
jgi:hypothetical protein